MCAANATPILESAQEFLTESLRNFQEDKLGFSIVHAVTATELVLKERVARLNPGLLYRNIDTKVPHKEQTVSLGALPKRLANLGMPLTATQVQLINDISEWRHQIVHHKPAFDNTIARTQLPQLLDFLAEFLRTQLNTPLETFLPKDLYKLAKTLLTDWEKTVLVAQAEATKEGEILSDICPKCGCEKVMCLRAANAVYCHLCGASLYRCDSCNGCGRRTVISYEPYMGNNFCDDCMEGAADAYIQQQIDIDRGK